jgi:hypothetical protein
MNIKSIFPLAAATLLTAFAVQAQSRTAVVTTPAQIPTPTNVQGPDGLFAHWDKDHNKALSLDEFKAGLHDNFVAHDTNKNNALDATEYAGLELIKKAGTTAPPLSAFDTDKNQSLDFKEYVGMVATLMKGKR